MPTSRCRPWSPCATRSSRPIRKSCIWPSDAVGVMNETQIIDVARDAIFVALKIAGGPMLAALIVGICISIFQALTQIQEQTLTFVPRIFVIFLSVLLLMPFML